MTAAGWYSHPEKPNMLRYWDGQAWTEHEHPFAASPPVQSKAAQVAQVGPGAPVPSGNDNGFYLKLFAIAAYIVTVPSALGAVFMIRNYYDSTGFKDPFSGSAMEFNGFVAIMMFINFLILMPIFFVVAGLIARRQTWKLAWYMIAAVWGFPMTAMVAAFAWDQFTTWLFG